MKNPALDGRFVFWLCWCASVSLFAEHEGKIQVLLVGDSTTEGGIPHQVCPEASQLEDVIRVLLAADKDLPPCNVINLGLSGEYIRRLLDSGRYAQQIATVPGPDYIFVRYGLNDRRKRENAAENYPKDYKELIDRMKKDCPAATIVVMSVIPYLDPVSCGIINQTNREVAEAEGVRYLDVYNRYAEELQKAGPNMLSYRRVPVAKIPPKFADLVKPFVVDGFVVVLDNQLDAHLGNLPGWFADRHPNLAGYHVIGDETAKFLAELLRGRI